MKSGEPARIVKPRQPKPDTRPVIALSRDLIVVESLRDEVFGADELGQVLRLAPPSILICQGFGKHLERLEREFKDTPPGEPEFNYRVTPIHRYSRPWDDGRRMDQGSILDAVCNFVGWRRVNEKGKTTWTHYHYPLDPIWFLTTSIEELDDRPDVPRIVKLYEWGKSVRDWCLSNQLTVKASAGGIAAQLLRDPRFYPEPRRKAPRLINNRARFRLPGNYYRLHANTNTPYNAIHIDMENAHHAMARRLRFPDVDYLHAYGSWASDSAEEDYVGKPFAPGTSPICNAPGLLHCRITVPHIPRKLFPPPYMESAGERDVYIYSNELELIRELGGRIIYVYSAYVSHREDRGLNRYAKWAIEEVRANKSRKPWLKPTLHATYGLLAARPTPFETGYYRANGGESTSYPMGNASIPAFAKKRPKEVESQIVNVIHRGMIEAEVRKQALWCARWLTEVYDHRILAIYADALFVEDTGRSLPLLEPPWRWKRYIKHVRWFDPTHFVSPSMSRLPGIPRTARERFLRDRELSAELAKRSERSTLEGSAARSRNAVARNMRDGIPANSARTKPSRRFAW